MKVYSLLYDSANNLKEYVADNQLSADKKYLVVIHTDKLLKGETASLTGLIAALLPNAEIIGCSVGGIIYKGESLTDRTLISVMELSDAEIKTAMVSLKDENGFKTPERLADEILGQLGGADDSFLFAYYSPAYPFPSQLVAEFNSKIKNYKMIGGGAYSVTDDLCNCPAYIIHGTEIKEYSIAVAKLSGKKLICNQDAITGIKSIGRTYKVTKSKEHRLIEIDGQPAKQWFSFLVGEEYLKKDNNIIHALPLVRKNRENLGVNVNCEWDCITNRQLDGDLFVFDEVRENDYVTAGYIDPESTITALAPLCEKISRSPVEALFAYSCLTRRLILHNCAKWELRPFTSTRITGAFMAGEFIYDGEALCYSNSAFTVATLSENPNATLNLNLSALNDNASLQFDNLPLVTYLFSTANSELKNEINESKQKLAEQLVTDTETGLPNLTKFIYDSQDGKYNALCLLSLKNESVIRIFLEKSAYSHYVNTVAEGCRRIFGGNYGVYRYSGLSVLIAANTADKDVFVGDMKKLKGYLSKLKYDYYEPIFEMSVVFGEDELLNKVELTYANLHKGSGDMLVYCGESKNNDLKKEMNLLEIINDAISYKRVIPYYQGIRNNKTKEIDIYESLMRIADKDGRIYLPGDFLPVAKEYKLYDRLSQMMIEKVLDDSPGHKFSVTINLNTSDIYNQNILNLIFDRLKKLEHPERLIFKIVESEAITDYEYLKTFTDKIHNLGAKIAVDDFGSGYSNLMHVLRIDLDFIKITGDIVKDVCTDSSCREFINMISSWANSRNKKVIAEFVENEDIQRIIKRNKVAYSQGYLFSKPGRIE